MKSGIKLNILQIRLEVYVNFVIFEGITTGKAHQGFPQLLIQQNSMSKQFVHQLLNKNPGTIQQIITHSSQPTIITQVSQASGQPITQMVAKVNIYISLSWAIFPPY